MQSLVASYLFALCLLVAAGCIPQRSPAQALAPVEPMQYDDLQSYLAETPGLKVVNFWATWCRPCLQEMPAFEAVHRKYKDQDVTVVLVSLDDPGTTGRLRKFVKKKDLNAQVIHLQNSDPNTWMNKVNEEWSGALPATLLMGKDAEHLAFHQGKIQHDALMTMVKRHKR